MPNEAIRASVDVAERNDVLVVHPGALGDCLLSVSALQSLKREFRHRRLVWVGAHMVGNLFQYLELVERFISFERSCWADLFRPVATWRQPLQDTLKTCDAIVAWIGGGRCELQARLESVGCRVIVRSPHDSELTATHMDDRFCETLSPWIPPNTQHHRGGQPLITVRQHSAQHDPFLRATKTFSVMVHPGSGSLYKCVSITRLATMVRVLHSEIDCDVVILKGPADTERVSALSAEPGMAQCRVVSDDRLDRVFHMVQRADLYIGHDSGISHLAALTGVPCLLLFGPTNPAVWAPRGSNVCVLQRGPCACSPEGWSRVQQCGEQSCLKIDVDRIVDQARLVLRACASATS